MRTTPRKAAMWFAALFFLFLLAWVPPGHATPPRTPITVNLSLSHAPSLGESATATVTVTSTLDAPGTYVELVLPEGVVASTTNWTVDLTANTPVTFSSSVSIHKGGNITVGARAIRPASSGAVWGDMMSVPLTIRPAALGPSTFGWIINDRPGTATPPSSSTATRPSAAEADHPSKPR